MTVSRAWRAALLAALPCLWSPAGRAAEAPCTMQEVGELPVVLDDGMPAVDAQINDQPARLLIDTGSDNTILFRSGAAKFHLALRRLVGVRFYGTGGGDDAQLARVTSLKVGSLILKDTDLVVVGSGGPDRIIGVLGAGFLTQADVEFDLGEGKIRFFRPKGCVGDQVVYWGSAYATTPLAATLGHGLHVQVKVNDAPVAAQLDSGSAFSTLTPQGAAKAGVNEKSPGVATEGYTVGVGAGKVANYIATFRSFAFGEEVIRNARLRIADMFGADKEVGINTRIATAVVDQPQMLLGADFFRSHRLYVSRDQKRVYVSYVGGPVFNVGAATPIAAPAK